MSQYEWPCPSACLLGEWDREAGGKLKGGEREKRRRGGRMEEEGGVRVCGEQQHLVVNVSFAPAPRSTFTVPRDVWVFFLGDIGHVAEGPTVVFSRL